MGKPKDGGRRGHGGVFQQSYNGRKTATWFVRYRAWDPKRQKRRQYNESSGSTDRRVAEQLLLQRLGAVAAGKFTPTAKVTWDELAADLVTEYQTNKRKSLDRLEDSLTHLRDFFGGRRASEIVTTQVNTYKLQRQTQDHAANGTINRELAALKKLFNLGIEHEKVHKRPIIKLLEEDNARTGFFERDQFLSLRAHLPEHLQGLVTTAFVTGWRIKSELCTRQWQHVDWQAGFLTLDVGEGKTKEGRRFPLVPELRQVLEAQREYTDKIQKETEAIVPWVFHANGRPLKHFRRSWLSACRHAGLPGRIPHDMRRTAVRNLERSGVSRSAAMKLVGHKTESIYRRYAIVNEADLTRAGEQLALLSYGTESDMGSRRRQLDARSQQRSPGGTA